MSRKILAKLIAASFALASIDAMACSFQAWTNTGTGGGVTGAPIAGEPNDDRDTDSPTQNLSIPRYSGRCASLASAPGNYVTDVSPSGESTYIAQFYVFTGVTGAGEVDVFQALNASNANAIRVTYNGTNMQFYTTNSAPASLAALPNHWYRVRLNWRNNAPMAVQIQGARAAPQNATLPSAPTATDTIESARLGWIAGANTGTIVADVFESRRNTLPIPSCRGDANGDGQISVLDRGRITGEVAGTIDPANGQPLVATGQPDCREDGNVNVQDRGCVTGLVAVATACPTAAP